MHCFMILDGPRKKGKENGAPKLELPGAAENGEAEKKSPRDARSYDGTPQEVLHYMHCILRVFCVLYSMSFYATRNSRVL